MPQYLTVEGLVINKKTIKEKDLFITLLTRNNGKMVAVAKGAKNIKSSRLSTLQLGNVIKAHLYQKDNYSWISETQTLTNFLTHQKTLTQLNLLFYFLEILNALIADNQQVDNVYPIALAVVDSINKNAFHAYITNEIKFLDTLGFGVPNEIKASFDQKKYHQTQNYIKSFLESIIEKKLESNKLFK